MNENELGVMETELAHPQQSEPAEAALPQEGVTADTAQPQDGANADLAKPQEDTGSSLDSMSEDDFSEYIQNVKSGEVRKTPPAQDEKVDNPGTSPTDTPFRVFKTQEEYQEDFNTRFSKRYNENKKQQAAVSDVLLLARQIYGGSEDEALKLMREDITNSAAKREGKDLKDFKETVETKWQAAQWREQQEAAERQAEIQERWAAEALELKTRIPDFDLEKAFENPVFFQCVTSGKSLAQGYINAFAGNAKTQAPPPAIEQNAARSTGGTTAKRTPEEYSEDEFNNYIKTLKGI